MTGIEWTDETWNPVTGCTRVSPGCDNCYMFTMYPRLRSMGAPGYEEAPDVVQLMRERLDIPYRWKKPRRVFVNSVSDMFHPDVPHNFTFRTFLTMMDTPQHTYQILTKRPGRAVAWWEQTGLSEWPANVWIGTSVENQKYAPRLTVLGRIPAPVRFVSAEPLLGPLDLSEWLDDMTLQWVIVGGESGRGARPMRLDWARRIRDQVIEADVPFFLKQLGGEPGNRGKRGGKDAVLDGQTWTEMP